MTSQYKIGQVVVHVAYGTKGKVLAIHKDGVSLDGYGGIVPFEAIKQDIQDTKDEKRTPRIAPDIGRA